MSIALRKRTLSPARLVLEGSSKSKVAALEWHRNVTGQVISDIFFSMCIIFKLAIWGLNPTI